MIKPLSQRCICITAGKPEFREDAEADLSKLPGALVRAIHEGWRIAPVKAHSRYASLTRACIAAPSNSPAEIARWVLEFPEANWCVETGRASGLAILEINHDFGQDSVLELCHDDWDGWTDTLQFRDDLSNFLLFRYDGRRFRFLPSRFEGLKVHAKTLVVLPPSWFVTTMPLVYNDLNAALRECPEWLLEPCESRSSSENIIPFPGKPRRLIA